MGSRILDGVKVNRRTRAEQKRALDSGSAEAYSDLRRVQVREENWRAMQSYRPKRFSGRLTLFKSSFVNDKIELPADYGWSSAAKSGLDIVSVTGHHLELFDPEDIGTLATALKNSLKRSSRRPS